MEPSIDAQLAAPYQEYEELVSHFRWTLGEHAIAAAEIIDHVRERACSLADQYPHDWVLQARHAETMRWLDAVAQRMTSSSEGW